MVKSKDYLVKSQLALVLLIPITPHIEIFDNLQLDDIPVLLFFILFTLNIFLKNIQKFYIKEIIPISLFISYIFIQNFFINEDLLFSDLIRYIFYLTLLVTILNLENLKFLDKYLFSLLVFLSLFSIITYFFKLDFGVDSYNYWKIGFNSNNWIFTKGRINGLQAGGPNAFGAIISCLGLYCIPNQKGNLKDIIIFISLFGCFLTYSRASLIVFVFLLFVYVLSVKDYRRIFTIVITLLITINFGLIDRFTSESETEGVEDRVQMQQASFKDISSRSVQENIFGYGFDNFGIVRNELKSTEEFSDNLRPTGPHNSFLFIILNYGFFGFLLFLNIFLKEFMSFIKLIKENIIKSIYLFLGGFVALSFTGDFIQNHSISVLFFLLFFKLILETTNE
tara:strand:- start:547 stop:1728 length:1182 start_codon:yes stop_codon:yes gene_type:complete